MDPAAVCRRADHRIRLTAFENLKKDLRRAPRLPVQDRSHRSPQEPATRKGPPDHRCPHAHPEAPTPVKKIIGNLSNTEKVLVGLDLRKVDVTWPQRDCKSTIPGKENTGENKSTCESKGRCDSRVRGCARTAEELSTMSFGSTLRATISGRRWQSRT